MGSRNAGGFGEDPDPNCNRPDRGPVSWSLLFVLGRFVELENLETNDVYRCKEDLKIPVSKPYDMMDIN